ncbi:MAG: hypothetical protein JSR77_14405 [Planctomycetes bacterium]|nr:hypothetical protein [Planctomycetota bacterium]
MKSCVRTSAGMLPSLIAAAAGLVASVGTAHGQMSWNGVSGVWSNPFNWTPNNVPDNSGETATIGAGGSYGVTLDGNFTIGGLTLTNPTGVLNTASGTQLGLTGTLANNSTITINAGGGGLGTYLLAATSHAWTGTGSVVLDASPNLDTAQIIWNGGGEQITQASTHTLRGTGSVNTIFVNNGTINADRASRTLQLRNAPKTNNSLMTATNGGTLDVLASVDQSGGGRIDANGGTVRVGGVTITGGDINVLGASPAYTIGNASFIGVTTTGSFGVTNGTQIATYNSLTNNGTITINPESGASGTYLTLGNSTALGGPGTVVMNASPNLDTAQIIWNGGGEVLTQSASHTIRGTGRINVFLTNNGNVTADRADRSLWLNTQTKTNNNLMTATNGGFLDITCPVNQGALGQVRAINGTVRMGGTAITGGLLSASGTGLLDVTGSSSWNSLTMTGPTAIESGVTLQLFNAITNNGTITVNASAGPAGTYLQTGNSLSITGTGTIAMNASPNLDTAVMSWNGGGEVLTLGSGQTLRGTGNVLVNMVNNGLISADVNGRTLQLTSQPKANNTTMKSIGGGLLRLANVAVNQAASAQLLADASNVEFSSATINSGNVRAQGGGRMLVTGTSRLNGVAASGPLDVYDGINFQIDQGLVNNGTITINSQAGNAASTMQTMASQTLSGSGTVVLNASPNIETAQMTWNGGGEVLTQSAGHTIRGTGHIYVAMVNNGLVQADRSGRTLAVTSAAKTNNATMKATGGGVLSVASLILNQSPAAQLLADGGSTDFSGATIGGGNVNAVNGGTGNVSGNSTFVGVTTSGPLRVNTGVTLGLSNGLTNNGVITVNPTEGGGGTLVQVLNSQSLTGTGQIVLNASTNLDTAYLAYNGGGEVLTQGASHTIRGTGHIYVNLLNNGLVNADRAGRVLELLAAVKTNNATMKATNGAVLSVLNMTLTQASGAQLLADASTVSLSGATINGGNINATNGGQSVIAGPCTLVGVRVSGAMGVLTGNSLGLRSGLVNNGVITVNTSAGGAGTPVVILESQTISGAGALYLNASANLDTSYFTYNGGGEVLTNDVNHTIGGTGRLYVRLTNNGIISPGRPGTPIGLIDLRAAANTTFGPDSQYIVQIAGPGQANADQITGDRTITLDGTLRIEPLPGYLANRGEEWTIISGASVVGGFTNVFGPAAVNGVGYKVEYFANRVVVKTVCYADVNDDGGIDGGDVQAFFALWEAGDPVSDLNNDGGVDGQDVEIFFQYWEGGGC